MQKNYNNLVNTIMPNAVIQTLERDALGRTHSISQNVNCNILTDENRYYLKYGDRTTDCISSMRFGVNGSLDEHIKYKYDKAGNISEIYENGMLSARYAYDKLDRLIREDNKVLGKTVIVTYDIGGNILTKTEYAFTLGSVTDKTPTAVMCYSYKAAGWRDQMTAFNGEKCEYDKMGRPTTYRSNALKWSKYGTLTEYGNTNYSYDANGIRLSKTVNGNTTKFYINNTKIVRSLVDTGEDIWYNYGVNGIQGITVKKAGESTVTEYVFRKNAQGDITHIYKLDTDGILTLAAKYKYDAWGKCTVENIGGETIGNINPIRYRAYYYDAETELYYLNARYYDPETGRFISADSTQFLEPNTINGLNLYAYCGDNPVMNVDPSGRFFLSLLIAVVVSAAASALGSIIVQAATTGHVDWAQVGISAAFGAVSGALSFTGLGGVVGQFLIQGTLAVGEMYSIAALNGQVGAIDPNQVFFTFLFAGAAGAVGSIGAAKEFKRIGQIESNLIKNTMKAVKKGAPLVKTFLSKGAKYINQFVFPFIRQTGVSAGISVVKDISFYWAKELWSKVKH